MSRICVIISIAIFRDDPDLVIVSFGYYILYTRVVPKVPLHSLFCHNKSMSELTTLMITKYYI